MIMIEKNTLSIKFYEQVIRLEEHVIEIKMHDKIIIIKGEDLAVSYYTSVEIVVHGTFTSVIFQ